MPGYAKDKGGSSKSLIFSNGTAAYSEKFYGFDIDEQTGNLTINEVDNKSEIISLPQDYNSLTSNDYVANNDYREWIWSGTRLRFNWGQEEYSGHLIMEVT